MHCSMKLSCRWNTLQTGQNLRTGYFKLNSNVFWLCLVVWVVCQRYFTYGLNVFSEFWVLKVLFGFKPQEQPQQEQQQQEQEADKDSFSRFNSTQMHVSCVLLWYLMF